jgi:hypothetical protein
MTLPYSYYFGDDTSCLCNCNYFCNEGKCICAEVECMPEDRPFSEVEEFEDIDKCDR